MKYGPLLLLCLCFLNCKNEIQETESLELFGAQKISTTAPEFASSVNAEQTEIFFNRTTADRSKMWLMTSYLENGDWSEAQQLPFSNGDYRDVDPFISSDGQRLYFSSNRPENDSSEVKEFHTWYSDRTNSGWASPQKLPPPVNSDSTEIFISVTDDGNLYFASERTGKRYVMVAKLENGIYKTPKKIELYLRGEPIRSSNPCIASDESFLIVAAIDPEGSGRPDLFLSWNENDNWSELINLGPKVNSEYADFAPGLSKDKETLYFTSERPGIVPAQAEGIRPPGDIYRISIKQILSKLKKH